MWKTAAAIILSASLTACASPSPKINCDIIPPSPTLPTIEEKELSCLSDSAYLSLVKSDVLLQQDNKKLRTILYEYCE